MSSHQIIRLSIQGSPFEFESIISWLSESLRHEYGKVVMGCTTTDYMDPQSEGWFTQLEGDTDAIGTFVCTMDPDICKLDFTISHIWVKFEKEDLSKLWPTWELILREIKDFNEDKERIAFGESPAEFPPDEEQDEVNQRIRHYFNKGLKDNEIGRMVNLSKHTVRNRRYKMNLKYWTQNKNIDT